MKTITKLEDLANVPVGTKVNLDLICLDRSFKEIRIKEEIIVKDSMTLNEIPCTKCVLDCIGEKGGCFSSKICLYGHRKDKKSVYFEKV